MAVQQLHKPSMNQLTLEDFSLFALIASHLNLSAVARERSVPPSQVSRALARIEVRTGVQLVHRTTHGLSLTDEGELFLDSAHRMIEEHADLQSHLADRRGLVAGQVRIGVSQLFAEYVLMPKIPSLLDLYPQLAVEIRINDRIVDLATESVDIVVRGGVAPAETMVVKPLGSHGRSLYASPAYLRTKGAPSHPDALNAHTLITNAGVLSHNRWTFQLNGAPETRLMQGRVRVNSSAAVVSLVLAGVGISRMNQVVGDALVAAGRLEKVLDEYTIAGDFPVYAAVLAQRHRAPKIRATIEFLEECFIGFR